MSNMANLSEGRLRLRSVCDLLGERFFVPDYQRGYRWGTAQVRALLDDLAAFQRSARGTMYYCLQPVVVCGREDGSWELVDGQQRLTTIRLILRAQQQIADLLGKQPFGLAYGTRVQSARFLENPSAELAPTDPDFYYIWQAYRAIEEWFTKQDGSLRLELINLLTRPDDAQQPNVRVIWYELESGDDPSAAFVRLNAGRIALTSAELIRASLLRSDERERLPEEARDQLAHDWDQLERRLQDDAFWFFLQSARDAPATRIEYLFDLWVSLQPDADSSVERDDTLATFLTFQQILATRPDARREIWRDFKRMAEVLEEWFEHPRLFHLVGFLVATAPGEQRTPAERRRAGAEVLRELLATRRSRTTIEFDRYLRRVAWHRFHGTKAKNLDAAIPGPELEAELVKRLEGLGYQSDGAGVIRALLLFNIAELLETIAAREARTQVQANGGISPARPLAAEDPGAAPRFQFARFWAESWDIEHVRSVAGDERPKQANQQKQWLKHARAFLDGPAVPHGRRDEVPKLRARLDTLLAQGTPDAGEFEAVFTEVRTMSGEGDRDDDDAISNLVLLDMGTNRSYRNAVFPVKRERIIGLDRKGVYLPPATRNVFLKYYSPDASQLLLWTEEDQRQYGGAIRGTLLRFFAPIATSGKVEA